MATQCSLRRLQVLRIARFALWTLAVALLLGQAPATDEAAEAVAPASPTQPTGLVASPSGANVAIITIEGMIDSYSMLSVERRSKRAIDSGASILVFEINTNGGMLDYALELSKFIKALQGVRTVAWINNKAYSAGIIIASACDELVMSPSSATGDTLPIDMLSGNLGEKERAKALAPMLAELRDSAQTNGYDYAMFHAMADTGIELYLVENAKTGERRLVNQLDYEVMVRGDDPATKLRVDFKMLEFNEENASKFTRPSLTLATAADRGKWRAVEKVDGLTFPGGQVHDGSVPFTVTQGEAEALGLSAATIADQTELATHLKANAVVTVYESWSEKVADFLMSMWVRGLLVVIMLVGFFIEFNSPGLGYFGLAGVIALLLLIGAPYIAGAADVWHIVLVLAGLALLVVEVLLLPSFGVFGVVGLVMMFTGLVLSVIPTTSRSPGFGPIRLPSSDMWNRTMLSALILVLAVGMAMGLIAYFFRELEKLPMFSRLVLQDQQASRMAAAVAIPQDEETRPVPRRPAGPVNVSAAGPKVGDVGQAITPLRPSGAASFHDHECDVILLTGMAERGDDVRVVETRGNVVTVEKV